MPEQSLFLLCVKDINDEPFGAIVSDERAIVYENCE
jgi:hypothetical protein